MQTLHIQLKAVEHNWVELRYFCKQPHRYEMQELNLATIQDLLLLGEQNYYKPLPDLEGMGQRLFFWLDGDGRWLSRAIESCPRDGLALAIDTGEKLAHLPWEVLHDGKDFLVKRVNPVVLPVRWLDKATEKKAVEARPLRVLFMATDPEGVEPKLDFEQEEAKILEDTKDFPLILRVEESGCITELSKLWSRYTDVFDVFHITGHASIRQGKEGSPSCPYFITETQTGERYNATAEEIWEVFRFRPPQLVFLSGCRTAQAADIGVVPSLAEELIHQGATAVLGWGRPVYDRTATTAAAYLYGKLAAGYRLTQALASTYQQLLKAEVTDWHLLRLYVRGECPDALVESLGDEIWFPPEPAYKQFLDPTTQTVRVATPQEFVGRRRTLQRCLQAIRMPSKLGVLIHGMGGVGKSTVTARLLERMTGYDRIFVYRGLDEAKLLRLLAEQCTSEVGLDLLHGTLPRMQRLLKFLQQGLNQPQQRFVFVLDDFEANLTLRADGIYVLQSSVVDVLLALLKAIVNSRLPHRVVITSRYDFLLPETNLSQRLYREVLAPLSGADLRKKYNRLASFNSTSEVTQNLQERAKRIADGNPRLLEWLDKILQAENLNQGAMLAEMEQAQSKFREDILAEELLKQQPNDLRKMLSLALVYELPVPQSAIAGICGNIPNLENYIYRAITLGLLELTQVSPSPIGKGKGDLYRVSRILAPVLEFPDQAEPLYASAAQVLYGLWYQGAETSVEAQLVEIHRLALQGKEGVIAAQVASALSDKWYNQRRIREVIGICQATANIVSDFRIFHNLARSERKLGDNKKALEHYQQALDLCPLEEEDIKTIIMAGIEACQGDIEKALQIYRKSSVFNDLGVSTWKQAAHAVQATTNIGFYVLGDILLPLHLKNLEFFERINDPISEAATLHEIASIEVKRGYIEEAITLYQYSLEIDGDTGNIQGKAATFAMLGQLLADEERDITRALRYLKDSLAIYQQLQFQKEIQTLREIILNIEKQQAKPTIINFKQTNRHQQQLVAEQQPKKWIVCSIFRKIWNKFLTRTRNNIEKIWRSERK
ncbi:CHAT domain-containing protein [Aetokthonos hydrillicola Thurmond2011]|jgi:tetratricopeptide (TPR) repeat protein|uniref:CHAT domain-containing protein n=1 Tax=Aetokthonos hydrillicola Thurmond2011 TaxID=2712845 RepID=A0AAP5IC87_9CYAN|nr:CHAT domain-containing protein [Aetokthonos hydrillicola]MBO3463588.1 CHAT domain-containing protein [Aetokthonos hydrillicola CCALA 1050]MDR9898987.1 CHAT domain-containing protein [Aetokthonos hydrillicola Thurmond2011]